VGEGGKKKGEAKVCAADLRKTSFSEGGTTFRPINLAGGGGAKEMGACPFSEGKTENRKLVLPGNKPVSAIQK